MKFEVVKVPTETLTKAETSLLEQALSVSYNGMPVSKLLRMGFEDQVGFFRITGPCNGIAALRVQNGFQGRELNVWLLAGKNLLFHLEDLDQAVVQIAKELKCNVIQADVIPRLAPIYERKMKLKPDLISVWKEV